jgi:hypothetical protein
MLTLSVATTADHEDIVSHWCLVTIPKVHVGILVKGYCRGINQLVRDNL